MPGLQSEPPVQIADASAMKWHDAADVVVAGFGAAGACAAIAAREAGCDVILVDRFSGGGAAALSGGVYYGGGTPYQREAGFDDTPDEMYKYLKAEVGGAVSDRTLRRFCEESAANLDWLARHGATFSGRIAPDDAPYMAPGYYLYYSGNERDPDFAALARPAPRGHITVGQGGSAGRHLFAALDQATRASGARILEHSPVTRLVIDTAGRVLGVEINHLEADGAAGQAHQRLVDLFNLGKGILYGPPARLLQRLMERVERRGKRRLIQARKGVILATGGFIHNPAMVAKYLPRHAKAVTLGSAGCTGAGILLGQSVGGQVDRMDIIDSSRQLLVPRLFAKALLVSGKGERFIAEDGYAATIGHAISERFDGKAWLILDAALYRQCWSLVAPWRPMLLRYRVRATTPLLFATRRAKTLEGLAEKCGMSPEKLRRAHDDYNAGAAAGADTLGKRAADLRPVGEGPYYAIDCATDSAGYPPTSFTLGGLVVDEDTGQVLGADGRGVPGLYAAGRAAVGVASNFYVSGLSIADCVFSGLRAARTLAAGTDA